MSSETTDDETGPEIELAQDYVPDWAEQLDLSLNTAKHAIELAHRHAGKDGDVVSGQPRSVAAGCIYAAALLHNDRLTQKEVAEVAGVTPSTIRRTYREVLEREGITTTRTADSSDDVPLEGETTGTQANDIRDRLIGVAITVGVNGIIAYLVGHIYNAGFAGRTIDGQPLPAADPAVPAVIFASITAVVLLAFWAVSKEPSGGVAA